MRRGKIYFSTEMQLNYTLTSDAKPRFINEFHQGQKLWITLCTNVRNVAMQASGDSSTLLIQTGIF
jgi:hypothetical protein